ncbi:MULTISPECIES: hypothetical protein [unclassified Rhodococcus (in: high G+C Gram-positive bacteria)]|uniref:baeRF2 domain-containing protein n=1 Tax=unclassified Rhodococcus (in: high G+C Gram-positive bacteria) TaxID=192944 RepID=UPI00117AA4EA|nr:hypothetical protein [Rhodococcus sp. 1163]
MSTSSEREHMQTDSVNDAVSAGAPVEAARDASDLESGAEPTEARFVGVPRVDTEPDPLDDAGPYVVVSVDQRGADIDTFDARGVATSSVTVESDTPPRRRAGEKTVAEIVAEMYDTKTVEQIFVVGVLPVRPQLVQSLPARVLNDVIELEIGSRADGSDSDLIRSAVQEVRDRQALLAREL